MTMLFLLEIVQSHKLWKNYTIFDPCFIIEGKEVKFGQNVSNSLETLKRAFLQVLDSSGEVVLSEEGITKPYPPFIDAFKAVLIRDDLLLPSFFSEFDDVGLFQIRINGDFNYSYHLLHFNNTIDGVDYSQSRYSLEKDQIPILQRKKIPVDIAGFFLSGWNSGKSFDKDRLYTIVNEEVKNKLLKIVGADEFLLFHRVFLS